MAYFYRRPNGMYYARIRVPASLRAIYPYAELRRSLNTSSHAVASRESLAVALRWKREFQQQKAMIDRQKLHEGSPLLLTPGRVSIGVAAGFIDRKSTRMNSSH